MNQPRLVASACLLSAAIVVGFAVYAGIFRPFTQVYDADLHYLYRALRFNSGLEQKYFDHTGYFYALVLSWWIKAVGLFGLIPGATLEAVRNAPDAGQAIAAAIYAGRVFSILLAVLYVTTIGLACGRLSGRPLFGAGAALLVASTPGIAYHAVTLRPELISALTLALAFAAILLSIDRGERQRLVLLGLSSGLAYLSVLAKMQAIIPLLFLPLLGLACRPAAARPELERKPVGPDTVCLFLVAVLVFLPFGAAHFFSVTEIGRRPFPLYSLGIAIYVLLTPVIYSAIHRTSFRSTVNAISAILIGFGAAYFITYFNFSHGLSAANAAFLDNLKLYGGGSGLMADVSFTGIAGYIGLASLFAQKLLVALRQLIDIGTATQAIQSGLALLALISAAFAFRAGERRMAIPIAVLMLAFVGTRTAFLFRGHASYYEPYFIFFPIFALSLAWPATVGKAETPLRQPAPTLIAVLLTGLTALQVADSKNQASAQTPHISAGHFCEFQKTWAPILREDIYVGANCWPIYARAIDPRHLPSLGFVR